MTKYLITGANGQVGHCLSEQLQGKGEILALSREGLDICNQEAVLRCIQTFQPDVVINAAAYTAVDKAETETALAYAINCQGAENLAQACQQISALMLHISTDYVFDGHGDMPYHEKDTPAPQSVYGKSKLAGEIAVLRANPRSIILRTAWVFDEHGNNFVKTMLRLGKERETLAVVADQIGSPTYAGDIATALIAIATQIMTGKENAYGIYHYSGQPYVSWYEFAQAIFAQAKAQNLLPKIPILNKITTADYPTPAQRPKNSRLSQHKIQENFGILPSDWQQALTNLTAYAS